MLLDSNILIYAAKPDCPEVRAFLAAGTSPFAASAVSRVEALGYHLLTDPEREFLEAAFASLPVLPLTDDVLDRAVLLRQARKMKLGDALIAATALVHGLTLVTRNVDDFERIDGLTLLNPFAAE